MNTVTLPYTHLISLNVDINHIRQQPRRLTGAAKC